MHAPAQFVLEAERLWSYGLYSYGPYSYGLYSYGLQFVLDAEGKPVLGADGSPIRNGQVHAHACACTFPCTCVSMHLSVPHAYARVDAHVHTSVIMATCSSS